MADIGCGLNLEARIVREMQRVELVVFEGVEGVLGNVLSQVAEGSACGLGGKENPDPVVRDPSSLFLILI